MRTALSVFLAVVLCACFGAPALAQNAISAKAGMINVADGDVFLVDAKGGDPRKVEPRVSEFVDIKEGQTLRTADGRAEVLLTPGSFLRMADNSAFKLFSNRLTDVRLELLSGSALIEATEMIDGNEITVLAKDATATLSKGGLYRFDADPARIRVYLGAAVVEPGDRASPGHVLSAADAAMYVVKREHRSARAAARGDGDALERAVL